MDAWRPRTSWFDRLNVWLIGFALARAAGVFAGAPLRAHGRTRGVTRKGLWAAFCVALAVQVLGWSLIWELVAPAIGVAPSWRVDLILSASVMATTPLFLVAIRIETPGGGSV